MSVDEVYAAVSAIIDPVYLVGGSVRDVVMGHPCYDYDFTTPVDADRIEELVRAAGRRPYLLGKRFGTIGFKVAGHLVEVTTFRAETYLGDSRQPSVEFLAEIEGDLGRRDFTMNALALRSGGEGGPEGGAGGSAGGREIIDLFGGRADIEARVIRAVGNPRERIKEDPLRMLRAARFASQLGFTVDPETVSAMERYAHRILHVARERWVVELDKLLLGDDVAAGLNLLAETHLLRYLLPELELQVGYDQNSRYHDRTLWEHTVAVVAATPPDVTLRWAALLHDVAKPYARTDKPNRSTYVKHDLLGAEIVDRTALYLKWSTARRREVRELVRDHMLETSPLKTADDAAKAPDQLDATGATGGTGEAGARLG